MTHVFIWTQGCAANRADSESMAAILHKEGHVIVGKEDDAELIILNTCTVKGPTERAFWKKLRQVGKPVVIAGCIAQAHRAEKRLTGHVLLGTHQIDKVGSAVAEAIANNPVHFLGQGGDDRIYLPRIRSNPAIGIVPISTGCLGHCTFCKTKQARGSLTSFPMKDIVRTISAEVATGAKEIWLTSQDCAAYGVDTGSSLPELMRVICSTPRDFRIRVGMGNPEHVLRRLDECVDAWKHPKVYKFLHLPLQAGSDSVLKDMRRPYTVAEFEQIIDAFRNEIPRITVSTDIIVGYPTETEKDFAKTLATLGRFRPEVFNVSRFWPRPGTAAARLKPLPPSIITSRTTRVMALLRKQTLEENSRWIGWEGHVLVTDNGKKGTSIARNFAYRHIVLDDRLEPGTETVVRIVSVTPFDLRGEIVHKA